MKIKTVLFSQEKANYIARTKVSKSRAVKPSPEFVQYVEIRTQNN